MKECVNEKESIWPPFKEFLCLVSIIESSAKSLIDIEYSPVGKEALLDHLVLIEIKSPWRGLGLIEDIESGIIDKSDSEVSSAIAEITKE